MTLDQIEAEIVRYSTKLAQQDDEIRRRKEEVVQLTANANCVKGVVQYLQQKYRELNVVKSGDTNGNAEQHDPGTSPESTDRSDGAVLDQQ